MMFSAFAGLVDLACCSPWSWYKKLRPARGLPRRRVGGVGSAAAGSFYELLSEERRKAIEIIVEDKAGYREAEDADGNLPDLEQPRRP